MVIKDKLFQLILDLSIIVIFYFSNVISVIFADVVHGAVLLQSSAEMIGYEKILLISKILTSTVLFVTAIYRFFDLVKNKNKEDKNNDTDRNTN